MYVIFSISDKEIFQSHWRTAWSLKFVCQWENCESQWLPVLSVLESHCTFSNTNKNKKAELPQRWPRDAPYIWVPWKFMTVPEYAHSYFTRKFSQGFVPIDWVEYSEVRSFTRSWDNRGYSKIGQFLDTPTFSFLPNFSWAFVRMDPVNVSAKFAVRNGPFLR